MLPLIINKTFKSQNYTTTGLPKAEYDSCTFVDCVLEESYLSTISFLECEFINCNLTNTKLKETTFKDVHFKDCKLVGMPFYECNAFLFSVSFNHCNLNLATFNTLKLIGTSFNESSLQQADFTEADLTNCSFNNCNLMNTVFENTILEFADFRTAHNFNFNPNSNKMKGAKFSRTTIDGLLMSHKIIIE